MSIKMPLPLVDSTERAEEKVTPDDISDALLKMLTYTKKERTPLEAQWDETYGLYRGSQEDIEASRKAAGSPRDWRHRVNTGKTLDIVETLVAYFKGATFTSDDWFDVQGELPEMGEIARVVKQLVKLKLNQACIRNVVDDWLRNLVIYGVSTYCIGWEEKLQRCMYRTFDDMGHTTDTAKNELKGSLTVEPVYPGDIWLDTTARINEGGVFRRLRLSKEELRRLAETGYYTFEDDETIDSYVPLSLASESTSTSSTGSNRASQEIVEYYGPLCVDDVQFWCVHATFYGKDLIRLGDSEYWCGSPYVTAVLLPNRDSIYGMSVLHPNLGALHILNVLTNSRLDNLSLHLDNMWTMVEDGILKKDDVKARPGAVFTVANHGNLQPVDLGPANFTVTYGEGEVQERAIDRNTSTGPLIGNAQPRGGDRVTAAEINGVRDAGGNRLSSVHSRIEDTATLPLLEKTFSHIQQYVLDAEVIRAFSPEHNMDAFIEVLPEYLHYPYRFTPVGAAYVAERQRGISEIVQLLGIAGQNPELSSQLNYAGIMEELLRQMRFRNPSSLIKAASSAAPPVEDTTSLGGEAALAGIQHEITSDGGESLAKAAGLPVDDIPPEQLQAMMQQMIPPTQPPQQPMPQEAPQ